MSASSNNGLITLNNWHYFSYEFNQDSQSHTVYLNGTQIISRTNSVGFQSNSDTALMIGGVWANFGTYRLLGYMADFTLTINNSSGSIKFAKPLSDVPIQRTLKP